MTVSSAKLPGRLWGLTPVFLLPDKLLLAEGGPGRTPSPFKVNFLLRFFCLENAERNVCGLIPPSQASRRRPFTVGKTGRRDPPETASLPVRDF